MDTHTFREAPVHHSTTGLFSPRAILLFLAVSIGGFCAAPSLAAAEADLSVSHVGAFHIGNGVYEFRGELRNDGSSAVNSEIEVEVAVDYDDDGLDNIVDSFETSKLLAGQSRKIEVQIPLTRFGNHSFSFLADPDDDIAESQYSNNTDTDYAFSFTDDTAAIDPSEPPEIVLFGARIGGSGNVWEHHSIHATADDTIEISWAAENAETCVSDTPSLFTTGGAVSGVTTVADKHSGFAGHLEITCTGPGGKDSADEWMRIYKKNAPNIFDTGLRVAGSGDPFRRELVAVQGDKIEMKWDTDISDPDSICTTGRGLVKKASKRGDPKFRNIKDHRADREMIGSIKAYDFGPRGTMELYIDTSGQTKYPSIDGGSKIAYLKCWNYVSDKEEIPSPSSMHYYILPKSADAPTVELSHRVSGEEQWSAANDRNIQNDDELEIRWQSENADTCTSPDFNTDGAWRGLATEIAEPTIGATKTYSVTCTGPGGSMTDTVDITTVAEEISNPNLVVTDIAHQPADDATQPWSPNVASGTWDGVQLSYDIMNLGTTPYSGDIPYRVTVDHGANGGASDTVITGTYTGTLDPGGSASVRNVTIDGLPEDATHGVQVTVDHTDQIVESNETDNVAHGSIAAPPIVPPPGTPPTVTVRGFEPDSTSYWDEGSKIRIYTFDWDVPPRVSWVSENADTCVAEGDAGFTTNGSVSGMAEIVPGSSHLDEVTAQVKCSNANGIATSSVDFFTLIGYDVAPRMSARVGGSGPWISGDIVMEEGESLELRWVSDKTTPDASNDLCWPAHQLERTDNVCGAGCHKYSRLNPTWRVADMGDKAKVLGYTGDTPFSDFLPYQGTFDSTTISHNQDKQLELPVAGGTPKKYKLSCARFDENTGLAGGYTWDFIKVSAIVDTGNAPTVDLSAQPVDSSGNVGSWTNNDLSVNETDTLNFRWESEDATNCTSPDFDTNNQPDGFVTGVASPAVGTQGTFTITCTGPNGTADDQIAVTTSGSAVVGLPDLAITSLKFSTTSASEDAANREWDNVELQMIFGNYDTAAVTGPVSYRFDVDYDNDGSFDETGINASWTGTLNDGETTGILTATIDGVVPGTHRLRAELDPADAITESNEGNNTGERITGLDVPAPTLSLTPDREVVREGQTAELDFSVPVNYLLNCELGGGGLTYSFTTPVAPSDSPQTTNPLANTTEFTLTCTDPAYNQTYETTATVEVVPSLEEI